MKTSRQILHSALVALIGLGLAVPFAPGQTAIPSTPDRLAQPDDEVVITLDEFSVNVSNEDIRNKLDETVGSVRINTRLIETPISVSVMPRDFIDNFMLQEVDDQLSFAAGGSLAGEPQSGTGGFTRFRGFAPLYYRNGFERLGVAEITNLERVELVKGPLSTSFGVSTPGGLINYVTRRASRKPSYNVRYAYGTYDYNRVEAHFTGPTANRKLFYRLDFSHTDTNGYQDWFYSRTTAASTTWTYEFSKDTNLTFEVERMERYMNRGSNGIVKRRTNFVSPVTGQTISVATGGIAEDLMRRRFNFFGPHFNQDRLVTTVDLRLEHRFNPAWSLRTNLQFWERPFESYAWTTTNYTVSTGTFLTREPFHQIGYQSTSQGQVDLLGNFKLGATAHKLLFTMDASRWVNKPDIRRMEPADLAAVPSTMRVLNAANPDHRFPDKMKLTRRVTWGHQERQLLAFMASDRVSLLENRALLLGTVRYDLLDANVRDFITPANNAGKNTGQVSSSIGGNFRLAGDRLVLFANQSTSFNPSVTIDRGTGELQDNVTAEGLEAGFKGELLNGRIYWTLSRYRIDEKDIPQTNPLFMADPITGDFPLGVPEFVGSGVNRSEGTEFELAADISKAWGMRATFGHMDARTHRFPDDVAREGVQLLRAPKVAWSLATTYRVGGGPLKGLRFGASARYTDSYIARMGRAGSEVTGTGIVTNQLRLNYGSATQIEEVRPEVTIYDAFASYPFRTGKYRHSIGLNIKNLTNKEWWSASGRINDERAYVIRYSLTL